MRCFVAAFVAAASAQRLQALYRRQWPLADADRQGSRTRPAARRDVPWGNYHVTLRFFGEVGDEQVPLLAERLKGLVGFPDGQRGGPATAEPLSVPVTGFAGLPAARRARLAAAMLAPHPTLSAWADALAAITEPGSALPESGRPFRPHVTVSRFRRQRPFPESSLTDPDAGRPEALILTLEPPALYRSETRPDGARYTRLFPA